MTGSLTLTLNNATSVNEIKGERTDNGDLGTSASTCSVGYVGYIGFAAQIPWTVILVHLPILETVMGGSTFSYALGIAMGLACNLVRFCVVVYGRMFTFRVRVYTGCVFSALFTLGYFAIYVFSNPLNPEDFRTVAAELVPGFWLGLCIALFGGAGNAQLMSTGYGMASLMSQDRPVANNLFFFGQAMASTLCWPLKCLVEQMVDSETLQLGLMMGLISLVSLSIIPIYRFRISGYLAPRESDREEEESLGCARGLRIFRQTFSPMLFLWLTFFCTNMVTPGQLLQWPVPVHQEVFHNDAKKYRSLLSYLYLLGDAVGKTLPVLVALRKSRMSRLLASKGTPLLLSVLVGVRFFMTILFFLAPNSCAGQMSVLVLFGLLNGLVASFALSLVSFRVDPALSDVAGYLSSFMIINGLFSGSLAGMLVKVVRDRVN